MIPPILFTQPSIANSKDFCRSLAPAFINITTIKNTTTKEIRGSHLADTSTLDESLAATIEESFKAAARPAIKAMIEKNATIRPVRKPLMQASKTRIAKTTSISIVSFYVASTKQFFYHTTNGLTVCFSRQLL